MNVEESLEARVLPGGKRLVCVEVGLVLKQKKILRAEALRTAPCLNLILREDYTGIADILHMKGIAFVE